MAVDNKYYAIKVSEAVAAEAGTLMRSIRRLVALDEQVSKAGIVLVPQGGPILFDAPEYGNGQALKHTDGQGIADALGSAAALKAWLVDNNHITNFDKVSGTPS